MDNLSLFHFHDLTHLKSKIRKVRKPRDSGIMISGYFVVCEQLSGKKIKKQTSFREMNMFTHPPQNFCLASPPVMWRAALHYRVPVLSQASSFADRRRPVTSLAQVGRAQIFPYRKWRCVILFLKIIKKSLVLLLPLTTPAVRLCVGSSRGPFKNSLCCWQTGKWTGGVDSLLSQPTWFR